jgi:ribosomal protein L11 methyltransferase
VAREAAGASDEPPTPAPPIDLPPAEAERWIEVRVAVPLADAEAVADALGALAAGGASIEPTLLLDDRRDFEYELDDSAPAQVRAWLAAPPSSEAGDDADAEQGARAAVDAALATLALPAGVEPTLTLVEPPDWAEEWRRFYRPLRIGRRLLLCPPWDRPPPAPGEVTIVLDPGHAFGTGQHESTRLCLAALERQLVPGADVLDLGTGSGVLAVAAARLGAASVRALDVDAEAVGVARESAARNGVTGRVVAAVGSLGASWPWDAPARDSADLALANISQPVLCELAPDLAAALRPGGVLIAAGYLARDAPTVGAALVAAGLRTLRVEAEGEWRCHVAVAPGAFSAGAGG